MAITKKKLLSLVMALVMVVSLFPVSAFATETETTVTGEEEPTQNETIYSVEDDAAVKGAAQIGDKYYLTLADALSAAKAEDTVTLLKDVSSSDIITIDKAITLDGNGFTLRSTAGRAINVSGANGVTIKNLVIQADGERAINVIQGANNVAIINVTANAANYALNVATSASGAKIIVTNCHLTGLNTVNVAAYGALVEINGGSITCDDQNDAENYGALTIGLDATEAIISADDVQFTINGDSCKAKNSAANGRIFIDGTSAVVRNAVAIIAYPQSPYYYSFESLQAAIDAAQPGDTVTIIADTALTEGVVVRADDKIVLDLNGYTITGTDNTEKNFSLVDNRGDLTITGNGKMTLTATVNSGWSRYSAVVANNPGGKLTVENGVLEHLGGTDMAYGIDNLTNGKGTYAETVINGGTIKSTYRGIRQFLNGVEAQNILTINGGTVEGTNKAIFFHDPSKNANTGTLTVNSGATLVGGVYLFVTEGSTEWPVTVSIASGEVTSKNVPEGYKVGKVNGVYTVYRWDGVSINNLQDLISFRDAVNAGNSYKGQTVTLHADIDLNGEEWTPIGNSTVQFQGTFNGNGHTISNLVVNGGTNSNQGFFGFTAGGEIKNLTIMNAKVSGRLNVGVIAGTPYTSKFTNITVTGHVEVNGMAYVGGVGGKNAYADWTNITVNVDGTSYVNANSIENGKTYRTYVGGVIGFMGEGGHTFQNISSNINVIGNVCDIGGITGIAHYGNNFVNVTCSGNVTNTCEDAEDVLETGGIAGVWHNGGVVTFENISYTGTVSAPNAGNVVFPNAGLIGAAYSASATGTLLVDGVERWPACAEINGMGYKNLQDAFNAAKSGDTLTIVADGTYLLTGVSGKTLTIKAAEGVKANIDMSATIGVNDANLSFENLTFNYANGSTYKGIQHVDTVKYTGCTINGQMFLYGKEETFVNCTFVNSTENYNVWTYGADVVVFENCVFNCAGKAILIYSEGKDQFNDVTISNCTITASAPVKGKAAIEMDSSLTAGILLTVSKTTVTGFDNGNVSGNTLWNNKKGDADEANRDITVVVDGKTILEFEHTAAEAVVENKIDATCTADGSYDAVAYCGRCGKELSREAKTISALGHSYEAVVTAPTCTEGGYTTHTCAVCDDSYVDSKVDATGHSYEAVVTAPTCTEPGYTTHTCAVCDDSYVDSETAATGHSYGVWYVVMPATRTENGLERRDCANCDHFEARYTDKLTSAAPVIPETPSYDYPVVPNVPNVNIPDEDVPMGGGDDLTDIEDEDTPLGSGEIVTVETEVTAEEIAEAVENGTPVVLNIEAVATSEEKELAPQITITTNSDEDVRVEIPVENVTSGTVVILVNEDGTETILTTSSVTENGVVADLPDGATVKIVDNAKTFDDVKTDDWFNNAVAFVSARGILTGVGESEFGDKALTSRAMVWTLLARISGVDTTKGENWYSEAQAWVIENGIADGQDPTKDITREELVTMMWICVGKPEGNGDLSIFGDVDQITAKDASSWAVENAVMNGMDGNMNPEGIVTRAQLAQFVMNYISNAI